MTVAKRLKFGRFTVPVCALEGYAVSVALLAVDQVSGLDVAGRIAVVVFMAGALNHILDKSDRNKAVLLDKIDDSVGAVWDAGERAGVRNQVLAAESPPPLAVVRDLNLSPR